MTEPCRIDPAVWRSLKIIDDLVVPLLADASGINAQHLRVIASHLQQVRGRLANQDWAGRENDPSPATGVLVHERWFNMRDNCDTALKLLGSMPVAIHQTAFDPEHAEELLLGLSDQLTSLSVHIEACEPEAKSGTHPSASPSAPQAPPERAITLTHCVLVDAMERLEAAKGAILESISNIDRRDRETEVSRLSIIAEAVTIAHETLFDADNRSLELQKAGAA